MTDIRADLIDKLPLCVGRKSRKLGTILHHAWDTRVWQRSEWLVMKVHVINHWVRTDRSNRCSLLRQVMRLCSCADA